MHDKTVNDKGDALLCGHFAESVHEYEDYGCLFVVKTSTQEHSNKVVQNSNVGWGFGMKQGNDGVRVWERVTFLRQQLEEVPCSVRFRLSYSS